VDFIPQVAPTIKASIFPLVINRANRDKISMKSSTYHLQTNSLTAFEKQGLRGEKEAFKSPFSPFKVLFCAFPDLPSFAL